MGLPQKDALIDGVEAGREVEVQVQWGYLLLAFAE